MDTKVLEWMSYLILFSTVLTMIFGLIAYFLYKLRERKPKKIKIVPKENYKREETIIKKEKPKILNNLKNENKEIDLSFNLKKDFSREH